MKRPELEEFIRLSSNPNSPWGMADSDTIEICQYALKLEMALKKVRTWLLFNGPIKDDGIWNKQFVAANNEINKVLGPKT